jgi:hypothetical protein
VADGHDLRLHHQVGIGIIGVVNWRGGGGRRIWMLTPSGNSEGEAGSTVPVAQSRDCPCKVPLSARGLISQRRMFLVSQRWIFWHPWAR